MIESLPLNSHVLVNPAAPESVSGRFSIVVLLVDDQPIIYEAVRRMLAEQTDITLHYCSDPALAVATANRVQPTVILQDLVMPEVDGLLLVKFYRRNAATKETPLIVLSSKEEPHTKAEAFGNGANDYIVKLPDKLELIARIRHHSKGYISLLERNQAYAALKESQQALAHEMHVAAQYLLSLLPAPTTKSPRIHWKYEPSANLGGDTFGYDWIDEDHLMMYVLDVTGHGLDSALFSVSVMNVMRSRTLPNVDFREPSQVLAALNEKFPMEQYGEKNFSMLYCVYRPSKSDLIYAGGGHPDGLLFVPSGQPEDSPTWRVVNLESDGPVIGMMAWDEFPQTTIPVDPGSRLYLYSDGCHEIQLANGGTWEFPDFLKFMCQPVSEGDSILEMLWDHVREIHGEEILDDDFSIVEVCFE